jgi:hypothetical protein
MIHLKQEIARVRAGEFVVLLVNKVVIFFCVFL